MGLCKSDRASFANLERRHSIETSKERKSSGSMLTREFSENMAVRMMCACVCQLHYAESTQLMLHNHIS